MAKDLAGAFPAARAALEEVDAALAFPLTSLMFEGPEERLQLTNHAQPAILAHSAAVLAVLGERVGTVVAAAGHSLGEYSAYLAARALSVPAAARLVRRRGELMLEAGQARPGTMAAVLGLRTAAVEDICREVSAEGVGVVVPANLNAPDQTVISGDPHAAARAGEACRAAGAKRVVPLKVSGAFHSPLMVPAVAGLRQALAEAGLRAPAFPVIANATAAAVTQAAEAQRLLLEQLTAPVRWVDSMRAAAALAPDAMFLEVGPGNVLSGLLKRIVPEARCVTLGTVPELERFLA
jgi:[acyl-carrier-protein] S-malonyltransferase